MDQSEETSGNHTSKIKMKSRTRKRKRCPKDSSSDIDEEDELPDNTLEFEKNVHASAVKNNLDDKSVRKILKKVVTNDHVLALVKLKEEEEGSTSNASVYPKLTRSKLKELKTISPASAAHLNMNLTPIKHIPVKTTPEVTSLIAQELPEDEDDDEYKPTNDDLLSDEDQTLESCSDLDSQPRTPATPRRAPAASPQLLQDGPFKVPLDITPARRKLNLEQEQATIALRTRSKLSLSATSIEHIESTFVPPDALPMQVDEEWSQFLSECLDPSAARLEEDDDDPEYNVAQDPDANDEDDDVFGNSIIKISKKELSDLVTELFHIMPEATGDDELAEDLANTVLTDHTRTEVSHWEGKQEPISDEDAPVKLRDRLSFEKDNRFSVGKSEPPECTSEGQEERSEEPSAKERARKEKPKSPRRKQPARSSKAPPAEGRRGMPAVVRRLLPAPPGALRIVVEPGACVVLPEQRLILLQQLRQHVQLAAGAFLQLHVHPLHWQLAPTYKDYLKTFVELGEKSPHSIAREVCNLQPAAELTAAWERAVSADTPENEQMVQFIIDEAERQRRCIANGNLYNGDFHPVLKSTVANSTVFQYPHLLPAVPPRAEPCRKVLYLLSEERLLALGLGQFWEYVRSNPQLYRLRRLRPTHRAGLLETAQLVAQHMLPWKSPAAIISHVNHVRAAAEDSNPLYRFLKHGELPTVTHALLPVNPQLTLYEQPEHEMPRVWVRYLARTSKRFRDYLYRSPRHLNGRQPAGVPVHPGVVLPKKIPLPISFTQIHPNPRVTLLDKSPKNNTYPDKIDIEIHPVNSSNCADISVSVPIANETANNITNLEVCDSPSVLPNNQSMVLHKVVEVNQEEVAKKLKSIAEGNQRNDGDENLPTFFQVVQTSQGAYFIPYNPLSTTGSAQTHGCTKDAVPLPTTVTTATLIPESSATAAIPETSMTAEVPGPSASPNVRIKWKIGHCKCCVLLRKICKTRQSLITEYFNPKRKSDKCFCSDISYPKVSNKLKLLLSYYKNKPQVILKELETKLSELKRDRRKKCDRDSMSKSDPSSQLCTLDELAFVSSFAVNLNLRLSMARYGYMKKRLYLQLRAFDPASDDPAHLAAQLASCFREELVDMYKEFLSFLTPEQADRAGHFNDYFSRCCTPRLVAETEAQVSDKEARLKILSQIHAAVLDRRAACDVCCDLLGACRPYPRLAEYAFRCFPHRQKKTAVDDLLKEVSSVPHGTMPFQAPQRDAPTPVEATEGHEDYEADHSSSGDDHDMAIISELQDQEENQLPDWGLEPIDVQETNLYPSVSVKMESINHEDMEVVTVTKVEIVEPGSDTSLTIASEDEAIKHEAPEWKREEDKLILEILQQFLALEEISDKASHNCRNYVQELEQKNVCEIISQALINKSIVDVRERVLYLLQVLINSTL